MNVCLKNDSVDKYFCDDDDATRLMSLAEAAKTIPRLRGKRVHTSTLFRWCKRGVQGICLKYRKIGRTIVVSPSDLQTFFMALADADRAPSTATLIRKPRRRPNSTVRQREIDAANDVLIRAGILKSESITV